MKIKEGCLLREIAGSWCVIVTGVKEVDFRGMISLNNDTAVFMYKALLSETTPEMVAGAVCEAFDTDYGNALNSVNAFIKKLKDVGIIDD